MAWAQWIFAVSPTLTWLQWLLATVATSALLGLAVRHFTKSAITHSFKVRLEKEKAEHAQELERTKAEHAEKLERLKAELDAHSKKELEYIKAEIALFSNSATSDAEIDKSLFMIVANVRATSYPKLVSLLRRMKRQFEGLHAATAAGRGAINLDRKSKRSELAWKAIGELADLEKEFDNELSSVRLFTTRSDYSLQLRVQNFCRDWERGGMLHVSDEFLRGAITDYNDDISYLSEEFYKPEIQIRQSGELLGIASVFGDSTEEMAASIEDRLDKKHEREQPPESAFWRRIISRKPQLAVRKD